MTSLAVTDGLLCLVALWLAAHRANAVGVRLACGLLAVPALLGFLRFSGLYPVPQWHLLFTILGASAALPLLAVSIRWPTSLVARQRHFALLFLGVAVLLGLLIAGLGKLRIYDQAAGLLSLFAMLWVFARNGRRLALAGVLLMLAGSVLFVLKVSLPPWMLPGDWLHLGMAAGLLLIVPREQEAFRALDLQPQS